jgi:hypothetical protein
MPHVRRSWLRIGLAAADLAALVAAGAVLLGGASHEGSAAAASPVPRIPVIPVPGLPASAAFCEATYKDVTKPYNAGARGTPMTSCPFVEQVRRAYDTDLRPGTSQLPVVSPATGKRYTLACMPTGSYATCTGAVGAVIYLYNRPPP